MSRKYYLDGGIEYLPDSGELIVDGKIESLQSLENKLLHYFVTHPNKLINKEELYEVGWEGRIFGDNPLSKAISNIRAKLKDNSRDPRYIKTIPKKGFRFISQVAEQPIAEETDRPQPLEVPRPGRTLSNSLIGGATAVILLTLSIKALLHPREHLSPQNMTNFERLTDNRGQDRDPDIRNDGRFVVFSRKKDAASLSQLVMKPLPAGDEIPLTDNRFDNESPLWNTDGKRILYHRYNEQGCEIALIELDDQDKPLNDKMLASCGKFNPRIGLSWGPDNSIYYTDIDIQFAPLKIYRLDLDSGERTAIAEPQGSDGQGYYRVHYDPQSRHLYALKGTDWYKYQTDVVTLSPNGQVLDNHIVKMPLFSISAYDGMPVFRSTDNHVRYLEEGKEKLLMQSPLWPIFGPNFKEGQPPSLVFVGGVINKTQLILKDFDNGTEEVLKVPSVSNKYPLSTASGNLYFISNQSGVYQVLRRSKDQTRALSQFYENVLIDSMAISPDEHYIALTIGDNIHVFHTDNSPFVLDQPYLLLNNSVNPHFSPDSEVLWSSKRQGDDYYLNAVSLSQKKSFGQAIPHAFMGIFDSSSGQHFAFKYKQPGLWNVSNDALQWYADAPLMTYINSVQLDNGILTYFDDAKSQVMQIDINSGKKHPLLNEPLRFMTKVKDQDNRWIFTRSSFSQTSLYLVQY